MTDRPPDPRSRAQPLGLTLAVVAVIVLVLIAVGRLPLVRGDGASSAPGGAEATAPEGETGSRPPAGTTPVPPPASEEAAEPPPRMLLAAAGGDHRWFLGRRRVDIGGYAIGHQGPEMSSDAFRVVSGFGPTPRRLVAFGPRAWVIAAPPVPGAASPVFALRVARNTVHDVWYPLGLNALTPAPRLPAGVRPLAAGASPEGPVLLAAPARTGGPLRLLRLGFDRWIERPLADPVGVDAEVLAAEVPLALAVIRLPSGSDPAATTEARTDVAPGEGPETAPPAGETTALTMLLLAGPDELAIDFVGASGERSRAWTGLPTYAAAARRDVEAAGAAGAAAAAPGGAADADADAALPFRPPFRAALVDADRQPWLAVRRGDELRLVPLRHEPAADGPGRLRLDDAEVRRLEATVGEPPVTVVGGDGVMLVEGDGFDESGTPARVRAWTSGGMPDLEGPLTAVEIDPGVILRGPIIIGTGIFFAVIIGVLSSRPGPRPPAIAGREATVGRRLGAAWIDALAPLVAAGLVFGWTPESLVASLLLLHPAGFAPWLGFTLLWSFASVVGDLAGGRTPGRLIMRIRPVDVDGQAPSRGRLTLRFAIRTISVAYPPLVMFWLAHARTRALHDLAAGTWVIRTDRPAASPDPPDESGRD